jgi:hypothetical protein
MSETHGRRGRSGRRDIMASGLFRRSTKERSFSLNLENADP